MLRELRGAITALALVVCVALAAVSFDVGIPGQDLLQSLRFHIAAALALLILMLLGSGAWWRAVLFLLPLIASVGEGANIVYRQQQLRITAAATGVTPLFRLVSFNLLNDNPNHAQIAAYILASGADVVMLMEANPLARSSDAVFAAYPYRSGCIAQRECSTIILSKWPLTDMQTRSLSHVWPNRLVTATADIRGTKVNLVLAHLTKPYFDEMAAGEVYRLAQGIGDLQGPVLLAGDFNAAAWSGTIARLSGREDLAPGPSYPATWPVALGPLGVPIDNVFARGLVIEAIEAIPDAMGSNHRGLIAEIALANPN